MSKKITQLKFLVTQIKNALFVTVGLLITATTLAQTTVVDFENPSDYFHLAWEGLAEVETNPNVGGLNTSATVGKYTIPAGKSWGNASVVLINTALNYKDLSSLEFYVLAPSGTQMYSKLELDGVGGVAEAYATPTTDANWQKVTLNFSALSGVDVNTATYNKFTFFFNVNDNVGGEEWYFDNITVVPNALSVSNEFSASFKVYPNPVENKLSLKGAQNFSNNLNAKIYNVTGKLIKEFNSESVNVSNLKSGLYILSVETGNGEKIVKKFIKN